MMKFFAETIGPYPGGSDVKVEVGCTAVENARALVDALELVDDTDPADALRDLVDAYELQSQRIDKLEAALKAEQARPSMVELQTENAELRAKLASISPDDIVKRALARGAEVEQSIRNEERESIAKGFDKRFSPIAAGMVRRREV